MYQLQLNCDSNYPAKAPTVRFITKVNIHGVNSDGSVSIGDTTLVELNQFIMHGVQIKFCVAAGMCLALTLSPKTCADHLMLMQSLQQSPGRRASGPNVISKCRPMVIIIIYGFVTID